MPYGVIVVKNKWRSVSSGGAVTSHSSEKIALIFLHKRYKLFIETHSPLMEGIRKILASTFSL